MKTLLLRPSELTSDHIALWRKFQDRHPVTRSPFFSPEYIQQVSCVRSDVEVALLNVEGSVVGIFPFQRNFMNIGRPVGLRLCSFTGILFDEEREYDAAAIVKSVGLNAWKYRKAVGPGLPFEMHDRAHSAAQYIDVSQGFQSYCEERIQSGSALLSELARKARNLDRDIGPVRFVSETVDESVFDRLLHWKAEQRRRTNTSDPMTLRWALQLMFRLRVTQTSHFSGILSALYAGDELVAAHFGVRSPSVLHYWFPAFNGRFAKYSPGSLLLLELVKFAAVQNMDRIDLGESGEKYKDRFQSGQFKLHTGSIDVTWTARMLSGAWYGSQRWAKDSPLREPLHQAKRAATRRIHAVLHYLQRR